MIVCLRTVKIPEPERARFLQWIADGRRVREAHGILAELVVEPTISAGGQQAITCGDHDVAVT